MKIFRILLFPFSILYYIIGSIRNLLFSTGVLKIERTHPYAISIGNLSTGGTGKTPHVEYINKLFTGKKSVILSRGYKRKTKGIVIATENSTAHQIGDEPYQYLSKFHPNTKIIVAEKRVEGGKAALKKFPEHTLLILDDAFQHQYIYRDINILLTEYNQPFFNDFVLPTGNLREARKEAKRATAIVVTKCPENPNSDLYKSKISKYSSSPIFFSKFIYGNIINFDNHFFEDSKCILVTGIAKTNDLVKHLSSTIKITKHYEFNDHHDFKSTEIIEIFKNHPDEKIICTEKDFVKLTQIDLEAIYLKNIYYIPIEVHFFGKEFDNYLLSCVEKASI